MPKLLTLYHVEGMYSFPGGGGGGGGINICDKNSTASTDERFVNLEWTGLLLSTEVTL